MGTPTQALLLINTYLFFGTFIFFLLTITLTQLPYKSYWALAYSFFSAMALCAAEGCVPFVFICRLSVYFMDSMSELQRAERVNVPYRVQGASFEFKVRAPLFYLQQGDELLVLRMEQGN